MGAEELEKRPLEEVSLENIDYPSNPVFEVPLSETGIDCFVTVNEV
tara:strand:+ start:216 stop:353 length:138 start_codon:yes stop_codon:yes gene_type:complete